MKHLVRRLLFPLLATTLVTGASVAGANEGQPKPEIKAEGERSPQGARLLVKGKNWPAKARIKVSATRAPASNQPQDFGMVDTDDKGEFTLRKVVPCTTPSMDDGSREFVTFTAADSATGTKATSRIGGSPWVCQ